MISSKVYIDVTARFSPEGRITPLLITWEDGKKYIVDKILDIRRAASLKAGGTGLRFNVKIGRQETFIYLEDGRWWAERK